ncbi:transposase [Halomonas litopenaei]|uniref:transposase n=1 Tax=Halomonas litopenaei TaxID=2109328 RepID=UPI003F9EBE95
MALVAVTQRAAVEDGHREWEASWAELLTGLRERGPTKAPWLAIADGALGFRKALDMIHPITVHQRCRVYKTADVADKLPKSVKG